MSSENKIREIRRQLHHHAPFTILGAFSGVLIMVALGVFDVSREVSGFLFWAFHPIHVLLSALVTAAMFSLHSRPRFLKILIIGFLGSIGIATLSDSIIPFIGEWLLRLPNRGIHIGFIEKWWLVNPLALLGVIIAWFWPRTRFPHAGHVFLSTWASLFHMTMAIGEDMTPAVVISAGVFLFLAVWIPCCTSDIVFPLMFAEVPEDRGSGAGIPPGEPERK